MCEQVENRGRHSPDTQGKHHESQLAHGRICQHPLDVRHYQTHRCRKQRGARANVGHSIHCRCRCLEHREETGNEEYTRGNHRGGVDQSADGGGAFHRVREPGVQRELPRLPHRPRKDAQRDERKSQTGQRASGSLI